MKGSATSRELVLRVISVIVIAFGLLGLFSRVPLDKYKMNRRQLERERNSLRFEQQMVASKPDLVRQYNDLRELMPTFKPDKAVDTHWLSVMDAIATKQHLNISRRQAGREEQSGEVYEFAIECREWDGRLDALVRFLYDLECEGVMLDVRQLYIRPHQAAKGFLRGSFTLYCAYMRDLDAPDVPSAVAAPTSGTVEESGTNAVINVEKDNAVATNSLMRLRQNQRIAQTNRTNRLRNRFVKSFTNTTETVVQESAHE